MSLRCHYGQPVSKDDGARRSPGFRRPQTSQRPQTLHSGRYTWDSDRMPGEPANMSDRRGAERLLGGLQPLFPQSQTIMADAGHESRKLARRLLQQNSWNHFGLSETSHYLAPTIGWQVPSGPFLRFSPGFGVTGQSAPVLLRFSVSYEVPQAVRALRQKFAGIEARKPW